MNNRPELQDKSYSLTENEDLQTPVKESQNREYEDALEKLVAIFARQAAERDFNAQRPLH